MMKMMQRTMYRFHCSRQRSGCSSCTFSNGRGGVLLKATYTFFYLKNMIKAFPGYPCHAKYVVLSVLGNLVAVYYKQMLQMLRHLEINNYTHTHLPTESTFTRWLLFNVHSGCNAPLAYKPRDTHHELKQPVPAMPFGSTRRRLQMAMLARRRGLLKKQHLKTV